MKKLIASLVFLAGCQRAPQTNGECQNPTIAVIHDTVFIEKSADHWGDSMDSINEKLADRLSRIVYYEHAYESLLRVNDKLVKRRVIKNGNVISVNQTGGVTASEIIIK